MPKSRPAEGQPVTPIAVIGMACRFSGMATSPEALWEMMANGLDGWSDEAPDRFSLQSFWHPKADNGGSFATRGLHLLKQDPTMFDADFFGIHNLEAGAMDPQQRLLLEVAYEAIENAGISLEKLRGSSAAVYCSTSNCDYETITNRSPETASSHQFTGTGRAILANRISYCFDLKGPSIELDTACSSGLVATHEACKAIRTGETETAFVGGANLILDPNEVAKMSASGLLSPQGRCYPFDNRANGFGRAEGVAMVILKNLASALRDGDPIRAVIVGSALSQDGRTQGIIMPSKPAQITAIKQAYEQANLQPQDTAYVEAHGTGTQVGDRTEAEALSDAFCKGTRRSGNLIVGSVKANIGHTESVAGLAGIIKSVLILEKSSIPANIAFKIPKDHTTLESWELSIPTKLQPWPETSPRRISINSFGYGGTNAHLVIESLSQYAQSHDVGLINGTNHAHKQEPPTNEKRISPRPFVLSHANEQGIREMASRLSEFVSDHDCSENDLESLSHTLCSRRTMLATRSVVIAQDRGELLQSLEDIASGVTRAHKSPAQHSVCLVFTGQGAQWAQMGAELLHVYPVYASSLKRSAIWLQEDGAKWDLLQELWKPNSESRINDAELSQPFCTALQIALVDLLQSFDVIFDTVCGHSSGEIAAAYAAGFLEGRDALRIAFLRGRAISQLRIDWPQLSGSMLAVGLPAADVEKYLNSDEGSIGVAAINSPRSVTLSGDKVAIQGVQAKLNSDGIFNRMLLVDVAYHHAAHMEKIQDEYVAQIGELSSPRRKVVSRMVSSVSGQEIYETDLNAAYWGRNLVSPVLFADALTKAFSHSSPSVKQVVVEVGPHAALRGPIKETFKVLSRPLPLDYQSLIIRGKHAGRSTLQVLGALFEHGVHLRFEQVLHGLTTGTPRVMYSLPTYPWTHGRQHWIESRISKQYRHRRFAPHDLLGTLVSGSTSTNLSWRHYIDVKRLPWVRGHKITSHIAFPATGYVCAVIEALRQCATDEGRSLKNTIFHFRHISITKALFLSEDERNIEFVVMLHPYDNPNADSTVPWRGFTVATVTKSGETMIHCSGLAACKSHDAASDVQDCMGDTARSIASIDFSRLTKLNTRRFYEQVKSIGIDYTGPFASLSKINASLGCVVCVASIPDVRSMMPALHQQAHCIHPATLDTCFQAVLVMMQSIGKLHASVLDRIDELIVSANISSQPGTELFVIGKSVNNPSTGDISVRQGYKEGPLVIEARGIHMAKQQDVSTLGSHSFSQRTVWHEDPRFAKATDIVGIATTSQHNEYVTRRHNLNNEFCRRVIGNVLASLSSDDEGRVKSHFLRYLQWMRLPGHSSSEPVTEAIRKEITSLGIVSEALLRFETELHSILIGDVDPMSVFFKDELLSGIYNDPYVQVNHLAAKYVELLESKNPNLRILVIGAGTASTTASILHHVYANGRRCKLGRFVFTDASPEFLEFTRDKLVSFADVLEFRTLDIESSPAEQGFGPGDFDLVIASNVSHGTDSTRKSIGNTRALLKPGGYLVLLEPVLTDNGPLSLPLLFGMLPSWWLGHEDGNEKSPLLSISQWHETLLKNGFSGLDVELQNYPDDRHEVSVLISTASPTSEQPKPTRLSVISCFETDTLANEVLRLALMRNPSIHVEKGTMDVVGSSSCYVILLEMVQSFLASCTEDQWKHFKHVLSQAQTVLWVTKGSSMEATHPFRALIHGTSRSFRAEEHSIVLATLDLDPTCGSLTYAQEAEWIYKVYVHLVSTADDRDPPDFEFAIRNGRLLIPRIVEDNQIDSYVKDIVSNYHPVRGPIEQKERVLQLHVETPGLLDTLHWRDSKRHGRPINANEVRVQMRYLSLNFKDLMIALGQLEGYSSLLIEGAGVVLEVGKSVRKMFAVGDLVAGFAPDSLATTANIDHRNVHHVPHGMPLEHAASIPVVYCTAYHSLVNIARIQEGEALLVHSAAGAVGQAAVALAQYLKVTEIYVTVGSAEKRQLMMEQFGIPQTNIFSSRNTTFKQSILRRTNGRGVDVVLNSLTGESARESLNLLAPFGRFIEIGKKDILTNARQEMLPLEKNITFATVDLSLICRDKVEIFTPLLGTVFNLVHSGKVQMISPISIHALTKFHETFKIMQLGKHTGKLIMSIDEDVHIPIQPKQPKPPTLNPEASYLVVGGTGGLGRAIIRHLVYLGAKHVITLSRSGSTNEEVSELIADLEVKGIELVVFKGSVTKQEDVEALGDHTRGRPIRGIIQAAMQLQDGAFHNMTYSQWRAALDPKVTGTWNLHEVFGTSLDHFILLSSISGTCGERGQVNYSAGNTFQDAFARHRVSQGLPARSINLSTIEDQGYVAENPVIMERMRKDGYQMQTLPELLAILDYAIAHPIPDSIEAAQIVCGAHFPRPKVESSGRRLDARFSHTWTTTQQSNKSTTISHAEHCALLKTVTSLPQAIEVVIAATKSKLARLLDASDDDFDSNRSLSSHGLDSLIAVELRNWIAKELHAPMQMFELMSPMSISELADLISRRSEWIPAAVFQLQD